MAALKGTPCPSNPMVHDYYKIMGWDMKTGKPYRRTLINLGLEEVAKDLWD
jgi:aldehyde:ferredoxin oxidoreductase